MGQFVKVLLRLYNNEYKDERIYDSQSRSTWLSGLKKIYDFSIPEAVHLREERYSWIFGNRNMSAHWQSLET